MHRSKASRKSSRARMEGRRRQFQKQRPGYYARLVESTMETVIEPNRARRLFDAAWKRGAPGRSIRQESQDKRRQQLAKARVKLKDMRHDTKQSMKRAAGET